MKDNNETLSTEIISACINSFARSSFTLSVEAKVINECFASSIKGLTFKKTKAVHS